MQAAQQSPAYLILSEENQSSHQDIDNIAQTRVLEKFGNLTSKKQEKTSLKNELGSRVMGQAAGRWAHVGHPYGKTALLRGVNTILKEAEIGMRLHVTIWIAKPPITFSDLGVSFWRGLNGEDGNLQHLYLAPYVVEALWLWHYAALGMELCWLPVSRERDSISQKSAATRWVFYSR